MACVVRQNEDVEIFILNNLMIAALGMCAFAGALGIPWVMIVASRHREKIELDHYVRSGRTGPLRSFVCPACFNRSYAPSHIARRWCARCQRSFPLGLARGVAANSALPRWFTDDLRGGN